MPSFSASLISCSEVFPLILECSWRLFIDDFFKYESYLEITTLDWFNNNNKYINIIIVSALRLL